MAEPRHWQVSGGIVRSSDELLLVANRRRDLSIDWTPPGGVVDAGETPIEALTREVDEETGLAVVSWSPIRYEVEVDFVDMSMTLWVGVYEAETWEGQLRFGDDPDGIVIDAAFVPVTGLDRSLEAAPPWVRLPLLDWLNAPDDRPATYGFDVRGRDPRDLDVRVRGS